MQSQLLEDLKSRQQNIDWRDTMRNGRSVNALLWRGSADATTVQRVGIAIFGIAFLIVGLFFVLSLAAELHSIFCAVFGMAFIALGAKITLNAFRHERKHRGGIAAAEKIGAMETERLFAERSQRADRKAFRRILNRKGGEPPHPEDRID